MIIHAILIAAFLFTPPVIAQSGVDLTPKLTAGKLRADLVCANCHGLDGSATQGGNSAISPRITAQHKTFLKARLSDYKSAKIQHPQMTLIAQMLTDEDIDNVSEWYSRIKVSSPWIDEKQSSMGQAENLTDPSLSTEVQAGKMIAGQVCLSCHGLYGRTSSGANSVVVPNLMAQQKEYLVVRLKDYKSGRIKHPQMSQIAQMLSDEDIRNVAEWYSKIEMTVIDPNLELSGPNE